MFFGTIIWLVCNYVCWGTKYVAWMAITFWKVSGPWKSFGSAHKTNGFQTCLASVWQHFAYSSNATFLNGKQIKKYIHAVFKIPIYLLFNCVETFAEPGFFTFYFLPTRVNTFIVACTRIGHSKNGHRVQRAISPFFGRSFLVLVTVWYDDITGNPVSKEGQFAALSVSS